MANSRQGLIRSIQRFFRGEPSGFAVKASPPMLQTSGGRSWLSLIDNQSDGYSNTPADWMIAARDFVWAANCVRARANAIAGVPIKLYQRSTDPEQTDDKEITDHPVVDLLRQINEMDLDETSFKREGERHLSVHGEWVISVSVGTDGKPVELYILQPAAIYINRDARTNYPVSFLYGGMVTYSPEQLIRIYYPRLDDPALAQSPTATAIAAMNRYVKADQSQETIDQAGGMTRGLIGVDFSLVDADQDQFMSTWNAKKLDRRRQHEDMFLPQGMKRESGVMSAQEQQRELRMERLKKEVFAAYGVPPAMAGDYSDASVLANADQQERVFWTLFGKSETGMIAEGFNTQLLWRFWPETREQGYYLGFDLSGVDALQENELEAAQLELVYTEVAAARYSGLISTLNESRDYLGLDKEKDPRADTIAFPEQLPAKDEPKLDENGEPVAEPLALSGDNMSQVRQVTRDFQVGKYTRSQAESLILIAAPTMSKEALNALLAPADKQPADVKPDVTIKDMAPIVDALDAFNQDMISLEQTRAILEMALPEADPALIDRMLQKPATRVAEQEMKTAQLNGEVPAQDASTDAPVQDAPQAPQDVTTESDPASDGEQIDTEDDEPIDEPLSDDDIKLDDETEAILQAALEAGAVKAFTPRDPDSIKRGPDGRFAEDPNALYKSGGGLQRGSAVNYNTTSGGKGKGKAKKPKKTDAQKEAEREKKKAERKAKRDAERTAKLTADMDALQQALQGLEGKDDPSNLRKRIGQQLERIQAKIDSIASGRDAGTQKLLNEAATKATPKHTGAMIALMLPIDVAEQLRVYQDAIALAAGGDVNGDGAAIKLEPVDELHVTLGYLGKAAMLSDWARELIAATVREIARTTAVPLTLTVKGSGRFVNPSGDVIWAGVSVEGLAELRACLVQRLTAVGINVPADHGDWQPHITLAYVPSDVPVLSPAIEPIHVAMNAITVMMAGERTDIPLGLRMPEEVNPYTQEMQPVSMRYVSAKAMPIVDFVGMLAIDAKTGLDVGVIEKIARFGEHVASSGVAITATKAVPVVYIDGEAYSASDVRVLADQEPIDEQTSKEPNA